MEQQAAQWRPWDEDQVFTFTEPEDWIFWVAGMGGEGAEEIAATREWGVDNAAVIGAIRTMDQDAVEAADDNAWGAGVWFPAAHGHEARAGVLIKTFPDRGDSKKAYRKFRKQAARVPQLPGVTISSYDVGEGEVDFGRFIEQVIDTVNDAGEVHLHWYFTLFSGARDEVVRLEFQSLYGHLVDEIEDEITGLIEHAHYGVKPGSALSKELGLE
ncbi:hypothetical protein ACFS27_27955 [Promicromonospora vindobonensis]|uniref:Uncharacterized protein n=1 Tax=Promicromonospora vindobonensis TaxID=195748 RepID=A0ABW5W3D7_9MICO